MTMTMDSRLRSLLPSKAQTKASVASARRLEKDNRGAIMVLGIFLACMMIGWMWMLVGLGDAMIWRDRSQDAADSVAYTSAAVHARGMNLISFLNIVMLIITALYLAMAFIYNILDFVLILTGRTDQTAPFCWATLEPFGIPQDVCHEAAKDELGALLSETGIGEALIALDFPEVASFAEPIHDGLQQALTKYESFMTTYMPKVSSFEKLVAEVAPWAGSAIGALNGYRYEDWSEHRFGLALSPSMIPASKLPAPVKEWDNSDPDNPRPFTGRDGRLGLPVQTPVDGMSVLCKAASSVILDGTLGFLKQIPVIGQIIGYLLDTAADKMQDWYCSQPQDGILSAKGEGMFAPIDTYTADAFQWSGLGAPNPDHKIYDLQAGGKEFWDNGLDDSVGGPKTMVDYASNGNDWMQVYSIIWAGNRPEQSEKKVALAGFDFNAPTNSSGGLLGLSSFFTVYLAQSEFYFDCEGKWSADECNGTSINLASYSMSWRTRLRRIHGLSFGSDLMNWVLGTSFGGNSGFDNRVTSWVSNSSAFESIANQVGSFVPDAMLSGAYGDFKNYATDAIGGMISPASALPNVIH